MKISFKKGCKDRQILKNNRDKNLHFPEKTRSIIAKKNQEIQHTIMQMIKPSILFVFLWANYLQFL